MNFQINHRIEIDIERLRELLLQAATELYGITFVADFERCLSLSINGDFEILHKELALKNSPSLGLIVHVLTSYFILYNQAEQVHIASILHEREINLKAGQFRAESVGEALQKLGKTDLTDKVLEVIPTLTAHPTEARRRSILERCEVVAGILFDLRAQQSDRKVETLKHSLFNEIKLLLLTDEIRAEKLSVDDEIKNGVFFLSRSIFKTVPKLYRELQQATKELSVPAPQLKLQYRSWIGGDRDGNPNVTLEKTKYALELQQAATKESYAESLDTLERLLGISERQISRLENPKVLGRSPIADGARQQEKYEPLRNSVKTLQKKLSDSTFTSKEFLTAVAQIKDALTDLGITDYEIIDSLLCQIQYFGFHGTALDIRQHSDVHERLVGKLLKKDYAKLAEAEKVSLLKFALQTNGSLIVEGVDLDPQEKDCLETLSFIRDLIATEPESIGSYIISMTHATSDILEVMLLFKACGFPEPGTAGNTLDIVPLFEMIEDLESAQDILQSTFSNSFYKKHLADRGNVQEVMLGYSDSNKDGGFVAANVWLQQAQEKIAQKCLEHSVTLRLFHGRGGSVGRGGGRTNRALLSTPKIAQTGRVRFTEQGEVISFRYLLPQIAHRHLEQIVNACLVSQSDEVPSEPIDFELFETLSKAALEKYRSLIHQETFWDWFTQVTPVLFIGSLPLASRPVSRSGAALTFESVRAIPWNFAWTQTRFSVPSWYGFGSGLEACITSVPDALQRLQKAYGKSLFFQMMVDNALQELARTRFEIAALYEKTLNHTKPLSADIEQEFAKTKKLLLQISQTTELLERNPVIKNSIAKRNPYTDILNLIQIEFMQRHRASTDDAEKKTLLDLIHASINGIAAAMQGTG